MTKILQPLDLFEILLNPQFQDYFMFRSKHANIKYIKLKSMFGNSIYEFELIYHLLQQNVYNN